MWLTKFVGGINLYLKEIVYYLDLPCVATFYLLLVIEFRLFCLGFLKIFLKVFLCLFLHMTGMILALGLTPIVKSSSRD